MTSRKPVDTLISTSKVTILPDPLFSDPTRFRQIVGALQYLTFTRPDICFAVNRVCQFMHAPTDSHWGAVKRILRYLRGTTTYGLHITHSSSFMVLQMQIGQVVLMITSPQVVISSSLIRLLSLGNLASNEQLLAPLPKLSIKPWLMALLRLSGFSIYCEICRFSLPLLLPFGVII
jgi:hypothetical protein